MAVSYEPGTPIGHAATARPPQDPTVGLCLGSSGVPREGGLFFYERGTPVTLLGRHKARARGHESEDITIEKGLKDLCLKVTARIWP